MKSEPKSGTLDIDYAEKRVKKRSHRYRLWRRTHEVLGAIGEFGREKPRDIIDLGTAEGRMLNSVSEAYPSARCVGIEYDSSLVELSKRLYPNLEVIQGDIQEIDFPDESFDVVTATAVMEHVPRPEKVLGEVKRVLRPGGIVIVTVPDPFWERVAVLVRHLEDDKHQHVMNIREMCDLMRENGFKILKAQKFMLSPFGMPFEFTAEMTVRLVNLDFLMVNQLVVAGR